jgi:hypothetical protein
MASAKGPDFSAFPRGYRRDYLQSICLGCVFHTYTKQLGLAPRTAYAEAKNYQPTVAELTGDRPARPFFHAAAAGRCPYCGAAKRSHATLTTHRIERCQAVETRRRALMKSIPKTGGRFQVHTQSSTTRAIFFEWLDWLGRDLDLDAEGWMLEVARRWLERREPGEDWEALFAPISAVRPSSEHDKGWEVEAERLFLAPPLYNEILILQYLVSRSHKAGGRTFQGRLTLPELVRRLRRVGYLQAIGADDRDQSDLLDKIIEHFTGGDEPVKLDYIVDRRDFMEKLKSVHARYE